MEAAVEKEGELLGHCRLGAGAAGQQAVEPGQHDRPDHGGGQAGPDGVGPAADGLDREGGERLARQAVRHPRSQAGGQAVDRLVAREMALDHRPGHGHAVQCLGRQAHGTSRLGDGCEGSGREVAPGQHQGLAVHGPGAHTQGQWLLDEPKVRPSAKREKVKGSSSETLLSPASSLATSLPTPASLKPWFESAIT